MASVISPLLLKLVQAVLQRNFLRTMLGSESSWFCNRVILTAPHFAQRKQAFPEMDAISPAEPRAGDAALETHVSLEDSLSRFEVS